MSAEQVRARQALVLGDGPRLSPLSPEDMSDEAVAMYERIRKLANRDKVDRTVDNLPEVVATMFRHPALFEAQTALGLHLGLKGTIPPRDRELAILRIAWLCGAPYEFGEHVYLARDAGISSDEVEAITIGADAPGWSSHEHAILQAVDELHSDAFISDECWAQLATVYSDKQLIELPILVGQYQQVAYVQNSLRLRLHRGSAGLEQR